jgi:hypothetical protein
MDEGIFPSAWKIGSVTPILKSGDPSNVTNYRPITILPHLSKIFELIALTNIKRSLNHVIIDQQHGFRPGKSTVTSSVIFASYILDRFDVKEQVDVIFTDFRKAFDTVDHGLLLRELNALGIGNPLLSWINSYTTSRTQHVRINDSVSDSCVVTSGVPQGSHLSSSSSSFLSTQLKNG